VNSHSPSTYRWVENSWKNIDGRIINVPPLDATVSDFFRAKTIKSAKEGMQESLGDTRREIYFLKILIENMIEKIKIDHCER